MANNNNNTSNTTDRRSGFIHSILNVSATTSRPGKRKFSEKGNSDYNGHSSFNSLDSNDDDTTAAFRHRAMVSAPGQIPKKQSSLSTTTSNNCGTATNAMGKIPRKIDSPESKNKKQRLEASSLAQFNQPLPGLTINNNASSSYHPAHGDRYCRYVGSNNGGNYGSASQFPQNGTNHNWKEIPPEEGEPHTMRNNGTLFHWCKYCNKENGLWTIHTSKSHRERIEWKKQPPKPGEPDKKTVGDKTFVWCQKCQNGSGYWGRHKTSGHRDTFRDRKSSMTGANTWDSNNEVSTSRKYDEQRSESGIVNKHFKCSYEFHSSLISNTTFIFSTLF